jgi:hypothetical protein
MAAEPGLTGHRSSSVAGGRIGIATAMPGDVGRARTDALVRDEASRAYDHPDGSSWTYSRGTLDPWLRAYRDHGLDGLLPPPRSDLGVVRRHPQVLDEACQLRRWPDWRC